MSLKLDWNLEYRDERNNFIKEYIEDSLETFSEEDLDMMAKYILWGKDRVTGLNGRQEGLELPTRFKTWESNEVQSLDALLETPSFSESSIRSIHEPVYRTPKLNFKRSEARAATTPFLSPYLESLFREIDETELIVTQYELISKKRTTPIRAALLKRFSQDEIDRSYSKASTLKQYDYLKKKHELIELRRLQYIYKDSYAPSVFLQPSYVVKEDTSPSFGYNIFVRPVGISGESSLYKKIFRTDRYPEPSDFTEEELQRISTLLWEQNTSNYKEIDLRDPRHLNAIIENLDDLRDLDYPIDSTLPHFLQTIDSYIALAQLKPFQRDILQYKVQHFSNNKIQHLIEEKYGKHYSLNYISTLYRQSVLGEVARTASKHREVLENLFYPENFKKCIDCGRTLLRDEDNFMKKKKVKDGFSPRCKRCEKILRDKRKEKNTK